MKKGVLSLIVSLLAMSLFAASETVNGIRWSYKISNRQAQIDRGSDSAAIPLSTTGAITIPSTLGGCPVTSIGASALCVCH